MAGDNPSDRDSRSVVRQGPIIPSSPAAWSSFRSTPRDFSLSQFLQHMYRRTFLTCPQYLPISAGFAIGWPRLHVPQTRLRPGRAYARAPHTLSLSQFLQYTNCRSFLTRLQNPPVPHALLSAGQASCLPRPPCGLVELSLDPEILHANELSTSDRPNHLAVTLPGLALSRRGLCRLSFGP